LGMEHKILFKHIVHGLTIGASRSLKLVWA